MAELLLRILKSPLIAGLTAHAQSQIRRSALLRTWLSAPDRKGRGYGTARLVFIDETAITTKMTRLSGCVETRLAPTLNPGDAVILDNLPSSKSGEGPRRSSRSAARRAVATGRFKRIGHDLPRSL